MHRLRHVYASMLASSGKVDMYVLQKLLTHNPPYDSTIRPLKGWSFAKRGWGGWGYYFWATCFEKWL